MKLNQLEKPEGLTPEYELKGPNRLFITGPLRSAHRAYRANEFLKDLVGAHSDWWPSLDQSIFFLAGVPYPVRGARKQVFSEDSQRATRDFGYNREIMFVNGDRRLDAQSAFYLGRAVASEQIEHVYYLGNARALGELEEPLAEQDGFAVISHPIEVFRWEAPGGFAVRALAEAIK